MAATVACDSVKRLFLNPDMLRQRSIDDYAETLTDARATLLAGEEDTIRTAFAVASWGCPDERPRRAPGPRPRGRPGTAA
ncbi:hypothetical protein ACFQ60_22415 [Streptomyces zhihengii]